MHRLSRESFSFELFSLIAFPSRSLSLVKITFSTLLCLFSSSSPLERFSRCTIKCGWKNIFSFGDWTLGKLVVRENLCLTRGEHIHKKKIFGELKSLERKWGVHTYLLVFFLSPSWSENFFTHFIWFGKEKQFLAQLVNFSFKSV